MQENKNLTAEKIKAEFLLFKRYCDELIDNLKKFKRDGIEVIAYGCPARFSTITNFAKIGKDLIPKVIDDSPLKQGRCSPGMHIPIESFNSIPPASVLVVFAYEYIISIKEKIGSEKVKYFKPIPFSQI